MKLLKSSIYIISLIFLFACEDPVDVDLSSGKAVIVADAILTNLDTPQKITLRKSQPYLSQNEYEKIQSATITMSDSQGNDYSFTEKEEGDYYLNENLTNIQPGQTFDLSININSEIFTAKTEIYRVPKIDSITWKLDDPLFGSENPNKVWLAQFWAIDPAGVGDTYWVRRVLNGKVITDNENIGVLAFDGAPGRANDDENLELPFIEPIGQSITPGYGGGPPTADTTRLQLGDTVGVHLYSISDDFADFMTILDNEIGNKGGLFATPTANVPTNFQTDSKNIIVGWFQISNVSEDYGVISDQKFTNR